MKIDKRLIFTFAVGVHGIGHVIGIFFLGIIDSPDFSQQSWVLTDFLGFPDTIVHGLALLWIVAMIGFLAVAWGAWSSLSWWRSLTWVMVPFSIMLFILWWNAFPLGVPMQAQIGNIVAFVGLLMFDKPLPKHSLDSHNGNNKYNQVSFAMRKD